MGSEIAAMMDHAVLFEIQAIYKGLGKARCEQERAEIAQIIGRPKHEVDFCFLVNLDNDTRHAWPRQLLLEPRYSKQECERRMHATRVFLVSQCQQELREWGSDGSESDAMALISERARVFGCSVSCFVRSCWADVDPQARVLWPEQNQPQPPVTPELNMPAEHGVCTIKREVGFVIASREHVHSAGLRRCSAYHKIVFDVVNSAFGKGPGQHDPAGSVRKLCCAARILATPKGQYAVFWFARGLHPPQQFSVEGTGGWWISESRWT